MVLFSKWKSFLPFLLELFSETNGLSSICDANVCLLYRKWLIDSTTTYSYLLSIIDLNIMITMIYNNNKIFNIINKYYISIQSYSKRRVISKWNVGINIMFISYWDLFIHTNVKLCIFYKEMMKTVTICAQNCCINIHGRWSYHYTIQISILNNACPMSNTFFHTLHTHVKIAFSMRGEYNWQLSDVMC